MTSHNARKASLGVLISLGILSRHVLGERQLGKAQKQICEGEGCM